MDHEGVNEVVVPLKLHGCLITDLCYRKIYVPCWCIIIERSCPNSDILFWLKFKEYSGYKTTTGQSYRAQFQERRVWRYQRGIGILNRRTENRMFKRKRTKGQTTIYKTLHQKQTIE